MTTTTRVNNWNGTADYDTAGVGYRADARPSARPAGDHATGGYATGGYATGNYATGNYAAPRNTPAPRYRAANYTTDIDQVRFWVGAGLTALIAALIGVIGAVVAHGIVHVPMMVNPAAFGLASAGIALAAAALYDGMAHVAPRPTAYFAAVAALVTTLATLLPFTFTGTLHTQIVMAAMNLGVGLVVLILVPMAAVNARR